MYQNLTVETEYKHLKKTYDRVHKAHTISNHNFANLIVTSRLEKECFILYYINQELYRQNILKAKTNK